MSAMEKLAGTQLVVAALTIVAVTVALPWMGSASIGFFSLLALIPVGLIFLRRDGGRVVVDERDREIDKRATSLGIAAAWSVLFGALLAATLWANFTHADVVGTVFLTWLISVQAAILWGVKGLVAVVLYRRQRAA